MENSCSCDILKLMFKEHPLLNSWEVKINYKILDKMIWLKQTGFFWTLLKTYIEKQIHIRLWNKEPEKNLKEMINNWKKF